MFIDTHCHLTFAEFDPDRAMVIGNAKKAGVKKFICPSVDPFSAGSVVDLASKHPGVISAAIGYHPYEAQNNFDISNLKKLLSSTQSPEPSPLPAQAGLNPIVAIGEIGLDYHLYKDETALGKKQNQKILFEEQLRLALAHNMPVIMHCRDAFEDFFDVLDSLPSMPRGVIHCFSGGLQELRFAQKRKLYVGVDGNLTYSKQLQATIPHVPLSMMLLETDAPYLTPLPHRGARNESKYIPLVAATIAKLHTTDIINVGLQTTTNATNLFHIA